MEEGPGIAHERQAERLEMRDEPLAAQIEYLEALKEVMAAAAAAPTAQYLWARAEFLLEKSAALAGITAEREEVIAYFPTLKGPPLFTAQAAWLTARLHLQSGDVEACQRAVAPLNFIREWLVIGPFDNEQGRSFALRLPPEENLDPQLTCQGKAGQVRWRRHVSADPLGYVNLEAVMRPNTECLAYALCFVQAARPTHVCLRIGSDDSFAAFLNGRALAPRLDVTRRARPDQYAYVVRLEEGWNALLIKVGQKDGEWGFYARFTDLAGQPLTDLPVAASWARMALLPKTEHPASEQTLPAADEDAVSYLADLVQRYPEHARACYYLGVLMRQRQLAETGEREERTYFRRAAERVPQEDAYWLALAQSLTAEERVAFDRDENLRRLILERVRHSGGAVVIATLDLASYYLHGMDNPERARNLLAQALNANPLSARGQALLFDLYRRCGWKSAASRLIAEAAKRHPRSLDIRLRQAMALMERDLTAAALNAWRAAVRADATDLRARQGEYAALRILDHEAAIASLRHFLALRPGQAWARLRLAEDLRLAGRPGEALAVADEILALCPDDSEALAVRGDCLHDLGRDAEADSAWQTVRQRQPGLQHLRYRPGQEETDAAAPTTSIADLAAFAQMHGPRSLPHVNREYLLCERADLLHEDSTRRRICHDVVRLLTRAGADDLRQTRVFYNPRSERVEVIASRALRAGGSLVEARLQDAGQGTYLIAFPALEPGDVVEIHYSVDRFHADFFGDYFGAIFRFRQREPVRLSRYILQYPKARPCHIHTHNSVPPPRELHVEGGDKLCQIWEMADLPALPDESYPPPGEEISPVVQVSTFANWDELARWYWHLVKPQQQATEEIRQQTHRLTDGLPDEITKLAALYAWVSNEIQNVAWSFGVHGYKPYNAETIFHRRFGDCKDKAMLLCVMAREIGLEADLVLLRSTDPTETVAGRGREDLALPLLAHFNHCIARVRAGGQVHWLDATARYRTLDGLPFSDAGAAAVVVTQQGAERVILPAPTAMDNSWQDEIRLTLLPDGAAEIAQTITGRGLVAVYLRANFGNANDVGERIRRIFSQFYGQEIASGSGRFLAEGIGQDTVRLEAQFRVPAYARMEEALATIPLPKAFLRGEIGRNAALPAKLEIFASHSRRQCDVILPFPFAIVRDIALTWPEEWRSDHMPTPMSLETPFGLCERRAESAGRSLHLNLRIILGANRITAQDYPLFRRFAFLADRLEEPLLLTKDKP